MENEIWKNIPGYDKYQISNQGRIRSLKADCYKILKPISKGNGYNFIRLSRGINIKNSYIHKIVAAVFLNHIPNGHDIVVDHINGNKKDNRLINLRLVSSRDNIHFSLDKNKTSSEYIGVSRYPKTNKWISSICINGKRKRLGYFNTEDEAHLAYQNELKNLTHGSDNLG